MADKRIIEQVTSEEILNDDWLIKDSVTEGTTKVQPSTLKEYVNVGMATAQALLSETQERESNDETLSGRITAETAARTNADLTLDNRITNEVNAREFADTSLSNRIDSEASTRNTADTTLAKNFADEYDASTSYEVGDLCIKDLVLYRCTTATTGTWDDTKWEETTVEEVLDEANKVDDVQTYGGNTLVTNKIADLSALTIKKDIPSTPTAIATFSDGAEMVMPSLKVAIEPQQDLHGYDSPWVGGAGKNKLQVTATSQTINGVTFTVNDDGTIKVNGTATADARFVIGEYILKAGSSVRLNGSPVDGSNSTIALGYQGYGIVSTANSDRVCDRTSASTDWDNNVYINVTSGYTANNLTFKPMIRLASVADATFAPYSNECPILGWDECKVTVADDLENPTVSNVYTIDLDGTRYGGKLDVVNGVLTADRAYVDLGSLDWTYYSVAQGSLFRSDITNMKPTSNTLLANCICSQYSVVTQDNRTNGTISSAYNTTLIDVIDNRYSDATAFKTAMSGVQLVYELATPQTIQLTPTAVKSLEGVNNVVADSGEILEGEYIADASTVIAGLDARITALENA